MTDKSSNSKINIRSYKQNDINDIVEVCYKTGFMGNSVETRFSDKYLFGLIFALYYPFFEPENCFVAENDGHVIGYCIGTTDSKNQSQKYSELMVPIIKKRIYTHTLWHNPMDVIKIFSLKRMMSEDNDKKFDNFLYDNYPSHLHIDILPEYHRKGIGKKLITRFIEHLKKNKVNGLHLGTTNRNFSAVPFYKHIGFNILQIRKEDIWKEHKDIYSLTFIIKLN